MSWRTLTPLEIKKSIPVFIANLFFSVHLAAIVYVNSSLLEKFYSVNETSTLFVIGAAGNLLLFLIVPHLLRRFGNRALFFTFVLIDAISTAGIAISSDPRLIAFFFLLFESVAMMIYFHLDIFLEDASLEKNTGEIRGIDLTLANAAFVIGPLLIPYFVLEGDFSKLYGISSLLLLPLIYQAFFSFKLFKDGRVLEKEGEFWPALIYWWNDGDVKYITIARFMLESFYALMVIYVPLYLHNTIGFSWAEIGIMFTIMLLPYVVLQLPAGEIADRWLGEKEILILGFFCAGVAALCMPFIGKNFGLWTIALFVSRIGASLIEVMADTYFFKKVKKRNTGLISIFRLTRPAGTVAGALMGVVVLAYTSYAGIFFTLAVISLWGIFESLRIRDTL